MAVDGTGRLRNLDVHSRDRQGNTSYLGYSVPSKLQKRALKKYILNRKRLNRLIHDCGDGEKEK